MSLSDNWESLGYDIYTRLRGFPFFSYSFQQNPGEHSSLCVRGSYFMRGFDRSYKGIFHSSRFLFLPYFI